MKKPSYRALVKEALAYSVRDDHKAAATAWLNAAEAAGRYDEAARLMCGREAMRAFNLAYIEPAIVGNLTGEAVSAVSLGVFYWPMAREGLGRRGHTRGAAYMLGGTAVIQVEGMAGCIALSHVLVIDAK
jgi:hypothetical protein